MKNPIRHAIEAYRTNRRIKRRLRMFVSGVPHKPKRRKGR